MTCMTPELPVLGCVLPTAGPTPAATPTAPPSAAPVPVVTTSPAPTVTVQVTQAPAVAVQAPALPVFLAPVEAPAPEVQAAPVLAAPVPRTVVTVAQAAPATAPLSGVVASSFSIVVFGVLGIALLLAFLSGLHRTHPHGATVNTHRTRLWSGLGVLALAAVVGGVGWYRLSGEPLLNRQIPFLASAGILVVLLSVLGGSLIIAEQLRGDQHRINDLEDAVRALTEALSPMVEQPPRGQQISATPDRGRSRAGAASST